MSRGIFGTFSNCPVSYHHQKSINLTEIFNSSSFFSKLVIESFGLIVGGMYHSNNYNQIRQANWFHLWNFINWKKYECHSLVSSSNLNIHAPLLSSSRGTFNYVVMIVHSKSHPWAEEESTRAVIRGWCLWASGNWNFHVEWLMIWLLSDSWATDLLLCSSPPTHFNIAHNNSIPDYRLTFLLFHFPLFPGNWK